ncbi:DinB family protein [Penaeicola halotolerans]|uniref:DinB family protein n=1 Tax=Penaeicola halotolerans TaxID=2793196 RepID=UPI001CF80A9A|nr:DinB family protein [Penaeicola halotolerans]
MKNLLFLFLLCFGYQAKSQDVISEFEKKWLNSKAYTLTIIEATPEALLTGKPVEGVMTFERQIQHIAQNMVWLSSTYIIKGQEFTGDLKQSTYTKAELVKLTEMAYDFALAQVKQITPEMLEETVSFFAGDLTKRQILALMNDHVAHHRGQLIIYLRAEGITPPNYVGW